MTHEFSIPLLVQDSEAEPENIRLNLFLYNNMLLQEIPRQRELADPSEFPLS